MTQQTNPSRPSEGAWRAAEKLISSDLIQFQGISSTLRLARKVDTATIIDRETGLAELLEAAKAALEDLEIYRKRVLHSRFDMGNAVPIGLEQAIAKAEGSGH